MDSGWVDNLNGIVAEMFREGIQHVSMPSVGSPQSEGHIIMDEMFVF